MTKYERGLGLFCLGFFLAFFCAISFMLGRKTAPKCPQILPADTTSVVDTSHHEEPEPAEVIPAGYELIRVGTVAQLKRTIAALEAAAAAAAVQQPADTTQSTAPAPPVDSTQVEVPIPIERKVYGGRPGDDYRAVVSGIYPKLESIDVYNKTEYITQSVVQPVNTIERFYALADIGADRFYRYARVGLGFEKRIAGPLYYNLSGGYEWTSLGNGGFMKGGLTLDLWRK